MNKKNKLLCFICLFLIGILSSVVNLVSSVDVQHKCRYKDTLKPGFYIKDTLRAEKTRYYRLSVPRKGKYQVYTLRGQVSLALLDSNCQVIDEGVRLGEETLNQGFYYVALISYLPEAKDYTLYFLSSQPANMQVPGSWSNFINPGESVTAYLNIRESGRYKLIASSTKQSFSASVSHYDDDGKYQLVDRHPKQGTGVRLMNKEFDLDPGRYTSRFKAINYGSGGYLVITLTQTERSELSQSNQTAAEKFQIKYGINMEARLEAEAGELPSKFASIELGRKAAEAFFKYWSSTQQSNGNFCYKNIYPSGTSEAVEVDARGEIISVSQTFSHKPKSFGEDLLAYFNEKYSRMFLNHVKEGHENAYHYAQMIGLSGRKKLRSLWLQILDQPYIVQVTISQKVPTKKELEAFSGLEVDQKKTTSESTQKTLDNPSKATLDTQNLQQKIQSTIRKSHPDVSVRVQAEQGTVHFYFDMQEATQDSAYLDRLVLGAVGLAGMAKFMYDTATDWDASKTYITYRKVMISWIFTVDCEKAIHIDEANKRADFIASRIHWVQR